MNLATTTGLAARRFCSLFQLGSLTMPTVTVASTWAAPASRLALRRRGIVSNSSLHAASTATLHAGADVERLVRLPRISWSYDRSQMDAAELADLLSQVACFAPGQSFHSEDRQAAAPGGCSSAHGPSSTSSSSQSSSSTSMAGGRRQPVDPARLGGAMRHSLVCVAAFAEEQHLPRHQHLEARGLAAAPGPSQQQQEQQRQRERLAGGWPRPRRTRRVLVGFARAVGDAALVATVHDVAVLPELQGLGLGRQLLDRLTRQLDMLGIIDVGLLAPDSCRGFFSACSFGRDTENSTVMTLSAEGVGSRAGLPLEGMAVHLRPPASAAGRLSG